MNSGYVGVYATTFEIVKTEFAIVRQKVDDFYGGA